MDVMEWTALELLMESCLKDGCDSQEAVLASCLVYDYGLLPVGFKDWSKD